MVGSWRFLGAWSLELGTWLGLRPGFVNLIDPVSLHSVHRAPLSVPPFHFNPHVIAHASRRKHSHRLVTRQISPPADHLLTLHRHRSAVEPNLRPDAPCVRRQPF